MACNNGRAMRNRTRRGLHGPQVQHLPRKVPVVQRLRRVQPLVALQPNQLEPGGLGQGGRERGLADAGIPLEEHGPALLEREKADDRQPFVGEITDLGQRGGERGGIRITRHGSTMRARPAADHRPGSSCREWGPSPSATFGRAPAVGDVCAHVDPAALTAIIGGGVHGSHLGRTIPPAGLTDEGCVFHLTGDADLEVGLCPVPMVAALPGADEALTDFLNTFNDDWKNHLVTGVGDRAVYDPLGTSTTVDLAAVKGSGLRWYGVVVFGYDPTPDRHVLGTVTEAQLAPSRDLVPRSFPSWSIWLFMVFRLFTAVRPAPVPCGTGR